jgi:AraC-like DNA-binding protein/CheY-like chemotaxis protein
VSAAAHFVWHLSPLSAQGVEPALRAFLHAITASTLTFAEVESVAARCLSAIACSDCDRAPHLVDQYFKGGTPSDCVTRFAAISQSLVHNAVRDHRVVQTAIEVMNRRHSDASLRLNDIAGPCGVDPSVLGRLFVKVFRCRPHAYLRTLRLTHAAQLLLSADLSVKEVWSRVGYNHFSNFDRDFRRHFHVSPREYRIALAALDNVAEKPLVVPHLEHATTASRGPLLIVDDDESTRLTLGHFLTLEGYSVFLASTGSEALLAAARVRPETILLDYHLPDCDGLECLRMLRRTQQNLRSRVIIFTADFEVQASREELEALDATIFWKLCSLEELSSQLASRRSAETLSSGVPTHN